MIYTGSLHGYVNHWEAQPPYIANYKFSSTEHGKENLPKRNLTRSGNLFWMHCKYKHKNKTKYTYIYIYIHYEERIEKYKV